MPELPYLSLIVWTPILGGVWVLLASGARSAPAVRNIALIVSMVTFLMSLPLWGQFDISTHQMQFEEKSLWIASFGIYYHLGVEPGRSFSTSRRSTWRRFSCWKG
jgi:NADH-quinone oxidoreductase subunit M